MSKTIVLFGSTGDLARIKLIPVLKKLLLENTVNRVVCVGRRAFTGQEYAQFMGSDTFMEYFQTDFSSPNEDFAKTLENDELFFYFATSFDLFLPILSFCANSGVNLANVKCAFEKPFGSDFESARELENDLKNYVLEDNIYRVDHYLGKPGAEDLSFVDQSEVKNLSGVEINVLESVAVGHRADFYDKTGAIRDVLQNHILQMLALIVSGSGFSKSHVLTHVSFGVARFGQYEGYTDIPGVRPDSKTETYFDVEFRVILPGWENVPFYTRSGKALDVKKSNIVFHFNDGNRLVVDLAKGDAYERIFRAFLYNERKYFASLSEILASWQLVDKLLKFKEDKELELYKQGSSGLER